MSRKHSNSLRISISWSLETKVANSRLRRATGRKIGWVVVGKTTTTHRRWTPPAVADMTVIGAGSSFEILSI